MELSDGPRLAGLAVLEVERAHEVVFAPHVLRDEVDLRTALVYPGTTCGK